MNPAVRPKLDSPVLYVFLLAAVATTFVFMTYYFFIPLRVDSGWYSYSALCLSAGRDPGENYAKLEDLKQEKGVKAIFDIGDDFRRSIRVIPMTLWFLAFGTTLWTVKLFGLFEYLLLILVMYLVLRKMCTNRNILTLCFALYLLDSQPIWYASTGVRPDVFITAVALGVFLLARVDEKTKYRIPLFFAGILLMFFLPLIRISSAISLVLLLSYFCIELVLSGHDLPRFKKAFYISLIAAGVIGYLSRDYLLDQMIRTGYSAQLPFHMDQHAYEVLKQRRPLEVLFKELERWENYFQLSNIGILLVIILGMGLLLGRILLKSGKPKQNGIRIGFSCLIAITALAVFAPRTGVGHALTVIPFLILSVAPELESVAFPRIKKIVIPILILVLCSLASMRFAQGIQVLVKSITYRFSNVAVTKAIGSIFEPQGKNYVVFGSTELWPYFNQGSNILIVDFRHKSDVNRLSDVIGSVDYILLDKFYEEEDWENQFLSRYPNVKLKTIQTVGQPMSDWYFLKVVQPFVSEDMQAPAPILQSAKFKVQSSN